MVSRDRAGLYAEAARQGAPQARQVADRFHLLQNFRESVERQLGQLEAPISDSPGSIPREMIRRRHHFQHARIVLLRLKHRSA